jgi:hypothetical protein
VTTAGASSDIEPSFASNNTGTHPGHLPLSGSAKVECDNEATFGPIPYFDSAVCRCRQKLQWIQGIEAEGGDVLSVTIER